MTTIGPWRKSSRSQGSGANCVELRLFGDQVQLRDSKLGTGSPTLTVSAAEFSSLKNLIQAP
ncbi:DUF397 domain-containing protein [Phytomonospora endophytica]|uniref:DUF397 domain-containing protein n=1 Tax=Phytomonospora endophytica TaxID=714109 RepID=A0A841FQI2_9ACTN|nr:DUF397 domain-containing protein [Phytomonospora endophytica]MBB6038336.1 hypothetical protein [Phytomonospora endophytica]GIG64266.1 hypothetical protein Pen01_05610 [Phytomonospora endophytica]